MAIDTLSGSMRASLSWTAQEQLTGQDYQPLSNPGNLQKTYSFTSTQENNTNTGADELISYLVTVAAGGNTTIDLTALTNVLQQANVSLTRIKGYMLRLLSVADDSVNGTNCSSVQVGNAAANQNNLNLGANSTFELLNGFVQSCFGPSTVGLALVAANAKDLFIENNDANIAGKVQVSLVGGSD